MRVDAIGLSKTVQGGTRVLQDVSLSINRGELIGVVGGSGAGKTTLLEALAGVSPAHEGRVLLDGVDLYARPDAFRAIVGYVPQDDIIHTELPLARTLRYAAHLRLPPDLSPETVEREVEAAMRALDLHEHAATRVADLSGGQRKRASVAVEMLTRPEVFFLDEPTSGLDPATGAELLRVLQALSEAGATVVLTTHAVQDLAYCDRVVFLARGGRLVFVGSSDEAMRHFAVGSVEDIYGRLESAEGHPSRVEAGTTSGVAREVPAQPGPVQQWGVLTARTFEAMTRNKLTLAILLGSPAMVVMMFAVLFRRGAFDPTDPDPTSILMTLFWITFGSFFFGLTYGLLQIVTERAILRREYLVGLRLGPYLLSKISVLLPFLVVVNVVMLVVLRALDRLPAASASTYLSVGATLTLGAAAALALGLLASAAVNNPSQATLALPMLCFPAVLFSGAILPVHVMASVGQWFSTIVPVRWAFEAVGHDFGIRALLLRGSSPLGPPLVASYGDAGTLATTTYWALLAAFTSVFFVAAWLVLARSLKKATR